MNGVGLNGQASEVVSARRAMRGDEIRSRLKLALLTNGMLGDNALVIEELGLRHGAARIDLALVDGLLHGFEIKGQRDSLVRLRHQASVYNSVFDRVTLVTAPKHLTRAVRDVPAWWGLVVASERDGAVAFEFIRLAGLNRRVDPVAQAKLLWRAEVLSLLAELGLGEGAARKPRRELYELLAGSIGHARRRAKIHELLQSRTGWRSA